jgi:FdhE protein
MNRSLAKWDQRIRRAAELATKHSFAAEALRFYERIAGFQKSLYASLETASDTGSLRNELELGFLLPRFPSFLALIESIAPAPLAQSAAELSAGKEMRWREVLEEFWRDGEEGAATLLAAEALLAWTFLQPYAEHLADRTEPTAIQEITPSLCPLCSGRPHAGVLRPLGDGAKRSLICSLCATEWEYRRLVCPACGEENVDKLPVYRAEMTEMAESLDHVRVEACDTCRHYIKTIDLTKTGRAVPVVDELAAIPLSLWAAENGYTKVSRNLLGL